MCIDIQPTASGAELDSDRALRTGFVGSRTGYPTGMQIPKAMVVERIRSAGGAAAADRADAELPEKVDTERDAELLRRFDLDPTELAEGLGGQSPAVG
jgi:hypothetical protein